MTLPSADRGEYVFRGFLIRAALHENGLSAQFTVWPCVPADTDGEVWIKDSFVSDDDDAVFADYEVEKGNFLNGFVKWDGCSNWTFGDPDCMMHFCELSECESIGPLMRELYTKAAELMGEKAETYWTKDCVRQPEKAER